MQGRFTVNLISHGIQWRIYSVLGKLNDSLAKAQRSLHTMLLLGGAIGFVALHGELFMFFFFFFCFHCSLNLQLLAGPNSEIYTLSHYRQADILSVNVSNRISLVFQEVVITPVTET